MADDDHLSVDLDVGSNELEGQLRRTLDLMTNCLQRADGWRYSFEKTTAAARTFREDMDRLQKAMLGASTDGQRDAISAQLEERTKRQAALNREIQAEIQLQKEAGLAAGAAARARDNATLRDGRTAFEARGTQAALSDVITGINTTEEQIRARIALAIGKAQERLLGATADAIEKSYEQAMQRQMSRNAQLSTPGYLDARVVNDRVTAEMAVRRAATGGTLAERDAGRRMYESAQDENRRFDAERRTIALRERAAADDENRQRTLEANRARRDAERENKERDGAYKARQNRMYAEAAWDNRQFDRRRAAEFRGSDEFLQGQAQRSFDARNAAFSLNGGADQFLSQARITANYAAFGLLTGAIRGSMQAVVEFDERLVQFQAITGTANSEMAGFRAGLLEVATTSKFSVNELTQVAVALGQTGLSASEVTKALKPVSDLAAASGSTLQESVEAITGVLGAYNMEAGRASEVADVFVAALNRTKLTMGQLQLGIQYAANIARDSGVSFSELTASIGAISQAGVKSGSTIGTGMRQLITELAAPTDKLRGVLKELGIDLDQVDLRTQGFSGVLQNLQKAGFGGAEALRAFDLRAAAAFSALIGQADKLGNLQQQFLLTSAATEGASKANESLTASGQRLANTVFAMADQAFAPLVKVLTATVGSTADLLKHFQDLGPTLPLIAAGVGSIATAFVALKSAQLVGGLFATLGAGGFAGLAPLLSATALVGATGGLIYFLTQVQTEAGRAEVALDRLKGVENVLTSRQQSLGQRSTELDGQIQSLIDRRDRLNSDPVLRQTAVVEAQKAFGDLGLAVDPARTSIDELIKSLQGLRGEMSKELPVLLGEQLANISAKIVELQKLQDARARENQTRTRLVPGVMGGTYQSDPLDEIRRLGPSYNTLAEVIADPKLLGDNPLGAASPYRRDAQEEANRLRIEEAKSKAAGDTAKAAGDTAEADRLNKRISLIEAALAKFNAAVSLATELQATEIEKRSTQQKLDTAELQREPAYLELKAAREELSGRQDRAVAAAGASKPGYQGFQAMRDAAHLTDDAAREQLAQIKQLTDAFAARGSTEEEQTRYRKAAEDAYREVSTGLEAILRGGTKEIRDRLSATAPAQKAFLNAQIHSDEAQLSLVNKQAGLSRDPDQVAAYQKLAEQLQGEINAAREQLFKVEQGNTPEEVVNRNPELQARRAEIQAQGKAKLDQLAVTYAEINKRLQEQLLSYRIEGENDRKSLIETQIKGLEKVRDDVRSTPEQMRAAVQEINRLLGEVAAIGKSINSLNAQRDALKTQSQGPLPPSVTFSSGSTQQRIVDELRAAGASEERIRYALTTGQIESGYSPDVISGARRSSAGATGLYQFMPGTWQKMYGTRDVDTDISAQTRAFQTFTDRNAGTFQSNMGRAASSEELYLMHQQGAAGAMALLRAGNGSALDALTGVYGDAGKARSAITGNGGRSDMSADEFVQLILRKFRTAEDRVGNPFGTTSTDEVKRRQRRADDTTAEQAENAKAENERKAQVAERAAALAQLRKEDRSLTEQYDTQLTLARRVQDPAKVLDANREAYKTLGDLFRNAQQRDENSPDRGSAEDREVARTATRKRFADLYSQQGLNQAETAGKAQLKSLNDELEQAIARKKELERPENVAREGNTALLNQLNEQINILQKRKELEGDYEANQAKIVALEETLKAMKAAGLDSDRDTLAIRERLRDLTEQQSKLEANRNFAGVQARTQRTYGEAFTGAIDSFEKQRGIRNPLGALVDPVETAQKEITQSLNTVGNAFDNLFTNLFTGSMKAGAALKQFATSILGGLMSQISRSLTNDIFRSLFSSGGDSGGGSIISAIGSLLGAGRYLGGSIRMAGGGVVPGGDAALDARDSKLILAQPGEFLLRRSAVDAIGRDKLDQVNALGNTMVNRAPKVDPGQRFGGGASASANVYVVDRDQVPPPSQNDIIHYVADNIQRGGALRQLVKSVNSRG